MTRLRHPSTAASLTFALGVFMGFSACERCAAQRYWDTNGRTSGAGSGEASGTWGQDNFWSTDRNGRRNTTGWTSGQQAVFSAGSDAVGTFTIGVSGNQVASGIVFEEGTLTLNGGTITLVGGVGDATIQVASGQTATIASQLAGTEGVKKTGTGTLIFSGPNSYTSITDLSEGLLLIANSFALGDSVLNLNGGRFGGRGVSIDLGNAVTITAGSVITGDQDLTFRGSVTQSGGSSTLTFDSLGLTTFSGSIFNLGSSSSSLTFDIRGGTVSVGNTIRNGGGNNRIVKDGPGTLVLSGASPNTFSGGLTLNAGTLRSAKPNALGSGALVINGGILDIGASHQTVGSVTLIDGLITGTSGVLTGTSYQVNAGTISAMLGGSGSLTKSTAGTLTMTRSNHFSGGLNLLAGTLIMGDDWAAGQGTLALSSGVRIGATGGSRTIRNPLSVGGNVTFEQGDALEFTDSFDLGGSRTFTVENTTLFSGVLSGSGDSLTKNGAGTLVLSANNTFGGSWVSLTVSAGTLALGHNGAAGSSANMLVLQGGAIQAFNGPRTLANTLLISGNSLIGGSDDITFTGSIYNWNGGVRTLTVTNTGLTTFEGSTLSLAGLLTSGTLTLDVSETSGGLVVNDTIWNGFLTGASGLVKSGGGSLVLGGDSANTFSGGFVLNAGSVFAAKANALGSGNLTINNGLLDIGARDQTPGTVNMAAGSIHGTSGSLTGSSYNIQSGAISARLGGTAALTKISAGTLTLSGASTYSGGTVINGGTVYVNNTEGSGTAREPSWSTAPRRWPDQAPSSAMSCSTPARPWLPERTSPERSKRRIKPGTEA